MTIHGRAHDAARLLGDRAAEAIALTNLGIISWRQGRYQQAADYHRRSLAASVEIGDRRGEATALANLGIVYERQGRYQRAAALPPAGPGRLPERRRPDRRGARAGQPGLRRRPREGQYERAVDWYQQALAVFREIGDRTGEASALPDLGLAYQRLGRYEEAVGCYQQALAAVPGDRRPDRRGRGAQRRGRDPARHRAAGRGAGRTPPPWRWPASSATPTSRPAPTTASPPPCTRPATTAWRAITGSCALELYSALGAPEADAIRAELDQPSLTGQDQLAEA